MSVLFALLIIPCSGDICGRGGKGLGRRRRRRSDEKDRFLPSPLPLSSPPFPKCHSLSAHGCRVFWGLVGWLPFWGVRRDKDRARSQYREGEEEDYPLERTEMKKSRGLELTRHGYLERKDGEGGRKENRGWAPQVFSFPSVSFISSRGR